MNIKLTKEFFEEHNIAALKADKGKIPKEVKEILTELGNPSQAIPYYAIYGPATDEPIKLSGLISSNLVMDSFGKVGQTELGNDDNSASDSVAKNNDHHLNRSPVASK